ncbi:hypothetical protein FRC20_006236 [Serendipita sp. 405]|nr:hypothetical protein FRC16_005821 [Serendipita sp. 398]KAG8867258.1 hypothetical protein FRC20_006236 [Serendipita sp. 405]
MSVPLFWADIFLSKESEDDLAKMVTCLTLSRECKITLTINSTRHSRDVYETILIPHADRITKICSRNYPEGLKEIFLFVRSLGYLPSLEQIIFPCGLETHPDIEGHFFQLLQNAPSLVSPWALALTANILHHPRARKFTDIDVALSFSEFLRILGANQTASQSRLPISNLDFLSVFSDFSVEDDSNTLLNLDWVGLLQPSPGYGNLFKRYFHSIRSLRISLSSEVVLWELFMALSSCPQIAELHLIIREMERSVPHRHDYPVSRSLNQLHIINHSGLDLGPIVEIVIATMPYLQDVNVYSNLPMGEVEIRHLGQLKDLWKLRIYWVNGSIQVKDPVYFDHLEDLEYFTVGPEDHDFMQFAKLRSLLTLTETGAESFPEWIPQVYPASYAVPPSSFNTLVELSISIACPVRLQLELLPSLEEMTLGAALIGTWAGDILEQIIITPKICPKLHMITIKGMTVEWDILFLMLLRRNTLHDQIVSKIQRIRFPNWPPLGLLLPMCQLLRGRFIPNLDLEAFSLGRIAKLLYHTPSESPRCYHCGFTLLEECKSDRQYLQGLAYLTLIPNGWMTAIESGWEYKLVDLSPDPPLPEYMAQWLSHKWDRRRAFATGRHDAEKRGQKLGSCFPPSLIPMPIVTGYTMEGVSIDGVDKSLIGTFTAGVRLDD